MLRALGGCLTPCPHSLNRSRSRQMFNYYSLFFLNGRAEKNLRMDSGAILAVIAGYCRRVKTELLRIESMRIVVVMGKEELLQGQHEAISGCLSPSRLCSASTQGPPTTQHAFIRRTEDNLILRRATIHDPNIHRGGLRYLSNSPSGLQGTDAKVNGRRIRTQPGMCVFYNSLQKENT